MPLTLTDLRQAHSWVLDVHRNWKSRSRAADLIASDKWQVLWDDLSAEDSEPLVENTLLQALTDKAASAATVMPKVLVAPTRNTRLDRAEKSAERRRRVFKSYWDRSEIRKVVKLWFTDWFLHGAAYSIPWTDWMDNEGNPVGSSQRFPYFFRLDPRHAFPLATNTKDQLTSIVISKMRRIQDLKMEYGPDFAPLRELEASREGQNLKPAQELEEIWYFDSSQWAVALGDPHMPTRVGWFRYVSPLSNLSERHTPMVWAFEPSEHGLLGCPVSEAKRSTHDNEYRGALDAVIPRLKVAQNFMARLLEDVADSVFAPVLLEGIENPEDYGPGAVLQGTGDGRAKVEHARPPVNFEARQVIFDQLSMARRDAKYPEQRSGEFGVSIGSAKGVVSVMGAFNVELADAQTDFEGFLTRTNGMTANLDEQWCGGRKTVEGFESGGHFTESYDPRTLFRGDYRNEVTYGSATGFDAQNHLIQLATMRNMPQGLSSRTFLQESRMVDDVLDEERERTLEEASAFLLAFLFQQAQQGNMQPLQRFMSLVDSDRETVRSAVAKVIEEMFAVPTEGTEQLGGAVGGEGVGEVVRAQRSLASGGIPGNAEGQRITPALRRMLPRGIERAVSEVAPGGTAA